MTPEKHLHHKPRETADSQAGVAASDSTHGGEQDIRNPLWTVAIGMAVLFGTMAAIVALAS